ncbi:MAG: Gfo/Idh/MocA family oxidoreductase [Bifidobacteriaceae bacterium]|jgi:predicted dehydrogenase|nr:Gfo/Idh/MocA family oxidoreductase [Bifidobacteriaceae bacterium]
MGTTVGIGIVGTGVISGQYLDTFARTPALEVVGVADIDRDRAQAVAAERGLAAVGVAELLADPRIAIVVNLTVPAVHAALDRQILHAGKHVYAEKPLALTFADGTKVLSDAARAGLRVGSAPDTFLGSGIQSAAALVRSGRLGEVFAASALWGAAGPELWHPNPDFLFRPGAGPVLDMGPYYLTALVQLLGPVVSVEARTIRTRRERQVGQGPRAGEPVAIEVPTHAAAILRHASGALSTVTLSFETWGRVEPYFELNGTEGSLRVPDPSHFDGAGLVYEARGVRDSDQEARVEWRPVPRAAGFADSGRGIGVLDMAEAIAEGQPHRASGGLALHVLEIMEAISASDGASVALRTTAEPAPIMELRQLGT